VKYKKSPERLIYTLKNEGKKSKTSPVQGWVPVEEGRVNEDGDGGQICVYLYKNKTMKLGEIFLRWGEKA
jgi:hypothetical protein